MDYCGRQKKETAVQSVSFFLTHTRTCTHTDMPQIKIETIFKQAEE